MDDSQTSTALGLPLVEDGGEDGNSESRRQQKKPRVSLIVCKCRFQ